MPPDSNALVSALLSSVSVGLASILVFHPDMRDLVRPSTSVLAPTWARIVAQAHAGTVFADGVRSIIGAFIGAAGGIAAYAIANLLSEMIEAEYVHVIATVLVIPVAFSIVLADPIVGSPLAGWMEPGVALLTLYIVASFSRSDGYTSGLTCFLSFTYGSLCAMFVCGSFRFCTNFESTRERLLNAVNTFCATQTNWLEGLTSFMTADSSDHSTELAARQESASAALGNLQTALSLAKSSDPWSALRTPALSQDLSVTMVLMHSQLLAFRGAITPDAYRDDSIRTVLNPILDSFNRVKMGVILALRPTTPVRPRRHAHLVLKDHAVALYKTLVANASLTALNRHSDLPYGSEVVRLHFATVSLVRFALLVDRFMDSVDESIVLEKPFRSMQLYWTGKALSLFSRSAWHKTDNLRYAYRAVVSQQIISQSALWIARADPDGIGKYILWAQLPVVFCFLPTFGGCVIKGGRRVLGTLAGGGIACITALANTGTESSYFLEMMIMAFVGKLSTFHPSIGYAGLVFAFTWFICILGSVAVTNTTELLTSVFYRMILSVGGVIASSLLAAVLFPTFSSTQMRLSMSKSVQTCANLVVDSVRGVIEGVPFQEDGQEDEIAQIAVERFKGAGETALRSLHKHIVMLHKVCQESRAEIAFIRNLCCITQRTPSVKLMTDSEQGLYKFIDAVLVLSATAAATRISQWSHSLFFTDQVVFALYQFAEKAALAGSKLANITQGNSQYSLDDCYCGDRIDQVEQNLMAVRRTLGESKKLPQVVKGGSPLIYVFHYALCELSTSWDNYVRELAGVDSIGPGKVCKFKREISSHSSLNIL